jgi:hypothetical protein
MNTLAATGFMFTGNIAEMRTMKQLQELRFKLPVHKCNTAAAAGVQD